MEEPININDLLRNFGMDRELLISKNQKYQNEFEKLDKYYDRYKESPSDSILIFIILVFISSSKVLLCSFEYKEFFNL